MPSAIAWRRGAIGQRRAASAGVWTVCRVAETSPAGAWATRARLSASGGWMTAEDGRTVDALALAAEEGRGHAAKCPGEALAAGDPGISEWGNPPGARPGTRRDAGRAPGELKHLSTPRKREDSLSSGERTGRSPNPAGGTSLPALPCGGLNEWAGGGGSRLAERSIRRAEGRWNGRPEGVRVP